MLLLVEEPCEVVQRVGVLGIRAVGIGRHGKSDGNSSHSRGNEQARDEFKQKKKFEGKKFTDDEWIQILIENPILLQRPIVAGEYKAEIMRD